MADQDEKTGTADGPAATVTIPADDLAGHIVAEAMEYGEWSEHFGLPDGVDEPEWSIRDIDRWDVDVSPDGRIHLTGETEGSFTYQTSPAKRNPPGDAHPAEYDTETFPVEVTIVADWTDGGLGDYEVEAVHA